LNKSFSVKEFQGFLDERPLEADAIYNVPWDATPFVWLPYGAHPHHLFETKRIGYICNACYAQVEETVFHCNNCDFDLCPNCYSKRSNEPAKNVDILGIYTNGPEFTLTNLTIGGHFNCSTTSLVKNALVWVTKERPDLGAYEKFNNFTKEKYESYEGTDKPLFITTNPATNFMAFVDLGGKFIVGKYVLIKLLTSFTEEEIQNAEDEQKKDGQEEERDKEEQRKEEQKEEKRDREEEGKDEEENDGLKDSQLIVAEFLGLWGYDGKPAAPESIEAYKLFSALEAKYDAMGSYGYQDNGGLESDVVINKFVSEFLKMAKEFSDGNEDLSQAAKEMQIEKQAVRELLSRLSYLTNVGDNPANALMLILPIIHLFRLFYGYNYLEILTTPM